jgi:transcriptional pleiotropic regulator of transition state genes
VSTQGITTDGTPALFGFRSVGSDAVDSGIARKIDDLGRIVIPAETRRMFNIREGDHLYIAVEGGNIVLRKMTDSCTFCGTDYQVSQFKGKGICASCRSQLES